MACRAEQETSIMSAFTIIILLSHKTTVSSELPEGSVTFSEKHDTTVDPFVVGAVPLLRKRLSPLDKRFNIVPTVIRRMLSGAEEIVISFRADSSFYSLKQFVMHQLQLFEQRAALEANTENVTCFSEGVGYNC